MLLQQRAEIGVHLLDDKLGEALGKLYVAKYFPPEAKAKADELVANLLKAYAADIQHMRASPLLGQAGTGTCHISWTTRESFYRRAGYRPWRRYAMYTSPA